LTAIDLESSKTALIGIIIKKSYALAIHNVALAPAFAIYTDNDIMNFFDILE
jgi:hypothetical protein